jgi:phospholipase/carboxylesterase
MDLDPIELVTAPDPRAAVIVLHGLGADGNDFVPVAHELDLGAVGPVRFVFPHAPTRPVTINGGYVMRAWYDILGLDSPQQREDEDGLRQSQALVEALIAREKARGIPAGRIVLAGFSQGCAMTLMTGLRHDERLAGLVGLSGYLPLAAKAEAERHAPIARRRSSSPTARPTR